MDKSYVSRGAAQVIKDGKGTDRDWQLVKACAALAGQTIIEYVILAAMEKARAEGAGWFHEMAQGKKTAR